MIGWSREAVALVKRLHFANASLYNSFGAFRSNLLSLVADDGALDLYHGGLRARDAGGKLIFDHVDYHRYWDQITEEVKPWSYMKFPYPAHARAGRGLVQGRSPGARAELRPHPHAPRRRRAPRVRRLRRRHANPRHAGVPLGEDDRDAVRRRGDQGAAARRRPAGRRSRGQRRAAAARRRRDRSTAWHADPPLPDQQQRPGDAGEPDRVDDAQQPGAQRGDPAGREAIPGRAQADRGAAQPHRGGDPRLRPLPLLRDARAGPDAARGRPGRR